MPSEIHVSDIGTQLRVQIKDGNGIVDISTASILQIILKKPDGTISNNTATLLNDGTDGIMVYVAESGVFDQDGSWKIQGYLRIGNSYWYTNIKSFKVERNLS